MRYRLTPLAAAIALTCTGLWHTAAQADIAEVVTENGDVMSFEYEGDMLRINTTSQGEGYMLMRDNKMYVVSIQDGQPMVFDLGSTMKMFGAMAESAMPQTAESKVISLKATGRNETLGGMQGEVYELHFIDTEGREQRGEMVLSKDPRALGFRDAIQTMALSMAKTLDNGTLKDEMDAGRDMQSRLEALDMGVLRYGKDMQIRSIEDTTIASSRFALPAEPTDLGAMMQGAFGGGQSGTSGDGSSSGGGMFGGLFGGSAEKEADKAPAEEKEKSAGEAMGEAVGEAFGKLFGN